MRNSEQLNELFTALSKFNAEQKSVKKDSKNPFLKNKYASLDALINDTRDNLSKNGLAVIQLLSNDGVETILTHSSGQWIGETFKIEPTDSKGLNNAQTMGVAITYTRRYAYGAILNLSTDEDTDGADQTNPNGNAVPKKQELTPNHASWSKAIEAVLNGNATIDDIKKKYILSKENEQSIIEQTQ